MPVLRTRFIERVFISQPVVVTNDLISRSLSCPAQVSQSPATDGRNIMWDSAVQLPKIVWLHPNGCC